MKDLDGGPAQANRDARGETPPRAAKAPAAPPRRLGHRARLSATLGAFRMGDFSTSVTGLLVALVLFSLFLLIAGRNPATVLGTLWVGAFGSAFSLENSLAKAAPLMLTALCTAIPARAGLVVIGNEAALLIGGLSAASVAAFLPLPGLALLAAGLLSGALAGGAWILVSGMLRQWRGVNETISSLLLFYVAWSLFLFLVEGPLRDPASLNKPSTPPIPAEAAMGYLGFLRVHHGLLFGLVACALAYVWFEWTPAGFAARVAGGNERAARMVGLPINKLILTACFAAGSAAGLAGAIEIFAVHHSANSGLRAGLGFSGILVSFTARHKALAIVWVAALFGGIEAAGGLLQRRHDLPDASTEVFMGLIFVSILAVETFRGAAPFSRKQPVTHAA